MILSWDFIKGAQGKVDWGIPMAASASGGQSKCTGVTKTV